MNEIEIYTRATITILGLAYPILLQVIARLDEKYSSNHIVELFDKEQTKKWFRILLVTSLVSIFIWSFKFNPLFQFEGWNYLIDNSANILVLVNSTALVVVFFLYVNKILVYYTPVKFINYLIRKHNKIYGEQKKSQFKLLSFLLNKHSKKVKDLKYFHALKDVFLLSVQKQNENISETISRFFYDEFRKEREKYTSRPVEYPEIYYSLVYKTIEELAILKNKKNTALEYRTSGNIWLLGELPGFEISEITYSWLWRNILLAVKYDQDDMILYHWERADQYFSYCLEYIYPEYHVEDRFEIKNKEAIEKRITERKRFLEFHYALGGLLLYKQRYGCIRRIFNYTNNEPPKFELLPENMDEIFSRYIEFRDRNNLKYIWISNKYWFPEQSGVNADGIIKKWISAYLAVLFLRQYTISPYLITMKPLDFPSIPKTQSKKRYWIENLDFFRKLVSDAMENDVLIETLKFKFLTEEWCKINGKPHPIEFIDQLKGLLNNEYEESAINQSISEVKIDEFYSSTSKILETTIDKYSPIVNVNIISENYNKWFINGQRMVQDKDAFSENPEVHHINYDSFLADMISNSVKDGIATTFFLNKTKSYLLKHEDLFSAIEKLGLNENYLIVIFGINLSYYIEIVKVKYLESNNFKGIDIIFYPGARIVDQSIFIIRKEDLPYIYPKEIESKIIDDYSLKKINEKYNLYASVLDLKKVSEEIRAENFQGKSVDELNKSLLVNIILSLEIRWKKKIELIQLIEYSEYIQNGMPNNLVDIEAIEKE